MCVDCEQTAPFKDLTKMACIADIKTPQEVALIEAVTREPSEGEEG